MFISQRHFARLSLALVTLIAGCGSTHISESGGAPVSGTASASIEYYIAPDHVPTSDGHLFARSPASGLTIALGPATDVWQAHSGSSVGSPLIVTAFNSATETHLLFQNIVPTASQGLPSNHQVQPAVAVHDSHVYEQQGSNLVELTATGSTIRTWPMPVLAPDPVAGKLPLYYTGIYLGRGPGAVSAIVRVAPQSAYFVSSTGRAAAISSTDGRTLNLAGYGQTGSAAMGSDGLLYVLAWRLYAPQGNIHVLAVKPQSMSIVASLDTGVSPDRLRNQALLPTPAHNLALALFTEDTGGIRARIWTLDQAVAHPVLTTGMNLGIDAAVDQTSDGLFLFGGPAGPAVNEVDLGTGSLTANIPSLRAPAGTFVVAVG